MISQEELYLYLQRQLNAKTLSSGVELKRAELLRRIDAGEKVEEGPITATIQTSSAQRFSADELAKLLGADRVADLKSQLPLVTSRSLKVQAHEQ